MTITSSAWTGDWHARALSRVNSRGYTSILDYLRDHPARPYLALAEELGPDVVAMQFVRIAFEDAQRNGQLRWASMDCLVREIHEIFPSGWGKVHIPDNNRLLTKEDRSQLAAQPETERIDFQKAQVFGNWVAMVDQVPASAKPRLRAVWAALQELCPPVGWLPKGPDDPLVVGAFEKGWPASDKIETVPVGPHVFCPKCGAVMPQSTEADLDQLCPLCGTEFPLL